MNRLWLGPRGLHIEPAEAHDAEALAAIHERGFHRGWSREDFASYIAQRDTPVYVTPYGTFGEDTGTPAGAHVVRDRIAAATRR